MRKSIYTNTKYRNNFFSAEKKQIVLNSLKYKIFSLGGQPNLISDNLISKTKLKNICFLSGRSRGVLRSLRISRINLRLFISMGLINGGQKLS